MSNISKFHRAVVMLPHLSIDLNGHCLCLANNTTLKPTTYKEIVYCGRSTPIGTLVADAWYRTPENEWKGSKYEKWILWRKEWEDLDENDKKFTGFRHIRTGAEYWVDKFGNVWDKLNFRKLSALNSSNGYLHVNLILREEQPRCVITAIHRLVAKAFVSIPDYLLRQGYTYDTLVVNHIDGNKHNNQYWNLEWVTTRQNCTHASVNNLLKTAISGSLLEYIWKLLSLGKTNLEISRETNVPETTISSIRRGDSPRYRTNRYSWPMNIDEIREPTKKQVVNLYNKGLNYAEIARKLDLYESNVRRIVHEHRDLITRSVPSREVSPKKSDEVIHQVCKALEEGILTIKEIGEMYGMNPCNVSLIKNGSKYTRISSQYNIAPPKTYTPEECLQRGLEMFKVQQEEHLTYHQLAKKFDTSISTVKRGLRLARKHL